MTDLSELSAFLDRLASAASDSIMPHFRAGAAVANKETARFDPVTIADRNAEQAMRTLINATYPEHGIIGEEFGAENADAEFVWVLDPIDGTRSFITGLPVWGTLIGLMRAGKPIIGMMAQPFTGERFAGDGTRAWYTGPGGAGALKVRPCAALDQASLFTTTRRRSSRAPSGTPTTGSRRRRACRATASTATPTAWSPPGTPTWWSR